MFQALGQNETEGGIVGGEGFDLVDEGADNLQAFGRHIEISEDDLFGCLHNIEGFSMAFNAVISLTITKDDGTEFAEFSNRYFNMDLAQVIELEEFGVRIQQGLLDMGKKRLAEKMGK